MKLSEELAWRGFSAEHTFKDISDLDKAPGKFYWGTDPSADSLHIGHLAALMMCACFVRHGYEPYLLVGGATGQIGDPKDNGERDLKGLDEIEYNKKALAAQISHIFKSENVTLVDNLDWFRNINYLEFLREIGKQFSMTQLLDRQFVQNRIGEGGSGISYAEFSYTLIQGYDFLHLFREHGVTLQLCGADQFGNCTSGIHLIKRLENAEADCYSCPLIIDKATGRKFGKSEGNAVWLDKNKTSIFDFYQFWLNQPDDSVEDYLKLFTLLEKTQIDEIMTEHAKNPSERLAQKTLAQYATEVVHGVHEAASAEKVTEVLFGKGRIETLDTEALELLASFVPTVSLNISAIEALVSTETAASNSEARQLIKSINGEKVVEDTPVDNLSIIKKGKNKFILVK